MKPDERFVEQNRESNGEIAKGIINGAKRGVNSAVELGQVTGNTLIIELLMMAIISGIKDTLDSKDVAHQKELARARSNSYDQGRRDGLEELLKYFEDNLTQESGALWNLQAIRQILRQRISKGEGM